MKLLICQMVTYTITDIQDYFLYIIKKQETSTEESPILIYLSKIKNRIVFKIKTGYKLQMLTNEKLALLGDGPIVDQNKSGKNVPKLEQVLSLLLHCNVVHNVHLQNSKLLYTLYTKLLLSQIMLLDSYFLSNQKHYYNQKQQILFLIILKFDLPIKKMTVYRLKMM